MLTPFNQLSPSQIANLELLSAARRRIVETLGESHPLVKAIDASKESVDAEGSTTPARVAGVFHQRHTKWLKQFPAYCVEFERLKQGNPNSRHRAALQPARKRIVVVVNSIARPA